MKLNKFKRVVLVVIIIVLAYFIYRGVILIKEKQAISIKKSIEIEDLKKDIEEENEKQNQLKNSDEDANTNEDYEELARKELGLIKKDEIVIKPR